MKETSIPAFGKITIRSVYSSDAYELQEIYTSESALNGLLQTPYGKIDYYKARIEECLKDDNFYYLVACKDRQIVGVLGLSHLQYSPRVKHTGRFHIAIREGFQGKGIGSALMHAMIEIAFGYLNLRRLELDVFIDNDAAIHLYKKFGFEVEGRRRDFAFRNGKYVDSYLMSRLNR